MIFTECNCEIGLDELYYTTSEIIVSPVSPDISVSLLHKPPVPSLRESWLCCIELSHQQMNAIGKHF